jgi:hypothetical protein
MLRDRHVEVDWTACAAVSCHLENRDVCNAHAVQWACELDPSGDLLPTRWETKIMDHK